MKLALQLVTYNSSKYLPTLFESLVSQKDSDWTLYILDNNSNEREETRALVHAFQSKLSIVYLESEFNSGFAGGHQKLYELHDADLVMLVNPDVILVPDFIQKQRAEFERCPNLGSCSGVIYRWDFDNDRVALSNIIDSLGIAQLVHGKIFDRGSGKFAKTCSSLLLGVSGCLPTYSRKAVSNSSYDGRLFDPEYHSYKEDVDIAYRLKLSGWSSLVVKDAFAYHRRALRNSTKREHISYSSQFWSYRNHLWNLLTYISTRDMVKRGWAILPYEMAKMAYFAVKKPSILVKTIKSTVNYYPEIRKKRNWYAKRPR